MLDVMVFARGLNSAKRSSVQDPAERLDPGSSGEVGPRVQRRGWTQGPASVNQTAITLMKLLRCWVVTCVDVVLGYVATSNSRHVSVSRRDVKPASN